LGGSREQVRTPRSWAENVEDEFCPEDKETKVGEPPEEPAQATE